MNFGIFIFSEIMKYKLIKIGEKFIRIQYAQFKLRRS